MKPLLDWRSAEVVNIYDEAPLWSAPFGNLLLNHIPMGRDWHVLDIGFGTGFPLIELAQRMGKDAHVYGMDTWPEAVDRTREKLRVLGLSNVSLFETEAHTIPLADNSLDLVCSNLGVNNFENVSKVLQEVLRVLKPGGYMCITTNPLGTFSTLYDVFRRVLQTENASLERLMADEARRGTEDSISDMYQSQGFLQRDIQRSETTFRFTSGQALFDHGLVRIAFRPTWRQFVPDVMQADFFQKSIEEIDRIIEEKGYFSMPVPILYLSFQKP